MKYVLISIYFLFGFNVIHAQSKKELFRKALYSYCTNYDILSTISTLEQIQQLTDTLDNCLSINFTLGRLYLENKDTTQAIKYYEKTLTSYPSFQTPKPNKSCKLFERSLKPAYSRACVKLAHIYISRKNYKLAEDYLHSALNKHKPNVCLNATHTHMTHIITEQVKLDLLRGDTIKARNSILDILFRQDTHYKSAYNVLKSCIMNTKKEFQDELLKGIRGVKKVNPKKIIYITVFNHTIYMGSLRYSEENLEDIQKRLLNRYSVKEILKN